MASERVAVWQRFTASSNKPPRETLEGLRFASLSTQAISEKQNTNVGWAKLCVPIALIQGDGHGKTLCPSYDSDYGLCSLLEITSEHSTQFALSEPSAHLKHRASA
jgi:hypothetical protein